ncbi:hypothetical protein ABK040_013094 [Willaertia magna]
MNNSNNRNNMFYSPNRITMNKRFYKKKLMSRSLKDLQELPEWRRLLRERNVEEIQFRKTLQDKYHTDDYKVKDGYFVRKLDEYQQLKNLHKLYSIINYND